jgi:AcrR family transcriptional regulator
VSTDVQRPIRRSQKERSAESGRRLIEAAIELGAEKGFDRTSVTDICRRAGYSKAMVHERYGSKTGLLRAVMETDFERWVTPTPSPAMSGLELALSHVDATQQAAADDPRRLRAYCVLCYETTGPMPELAAWFRAALGRQRDGIASALRRGKRDGSVRSDLNVNLAARQFSTYLLGTCLQWSLDPDFIDLQHELPRWRRELKAAWKA